MRYLEDSLFGMNVSSDKASEIDGYSLSPLDLENPKTSHDFQLLLTGERKKVLELGPATGYISNILKIHDCEVIGIEIDSNFAKKAKKILDQVIVGDVEELDLNKVLGSKKFDVILIGDVLEHLKNPEKLLKKLPKFLAKKGYLVCSIPNITHGSIRLKLLNGEFSYKETGLLDKTHLRFFTLESIISLFDSTGYSITELNKVKVDLFGADGADINQNSIPGQLLEVLLKDEESTTFQYVFKASPRDIKKLNNKKWLQKISKIPTENLKDTLENYISQVETLQKINLTHSSKIQEKDSQITSLQNTNQEKDSQITSLQNTNQAKDSEITSLQNTNKEKDSEITSLQNTNKEKDSQITSLQNTNKEKDSQITSLQKNIQEIDPQITSLQKINQEKDSQITSLQKINQEKDSQITSLQNTNQERDSQITSLQNTNQERDSQITSLQNTNQKLKSRDVLKENLELQNFIIESEKAMHAKLNEIDTLEKSIVNYQKMIIDIHQSFVFRMLHKYDRTIGKVLPLRLKKFLASTKIESSEKEQSTQKALVKNKMNLKKKDIICFPIINWDYRTQRPQHLMSKFSESGHRVFYFTVTLRKLSRPYEIKELENNIFQVELNSPKFFDIYKDKFNRDTIHYLIKSFRKLQEEFNLDAILFIQFPTWSPFAQELKKEFGYKMVFDCLDDFGGFGNVIKERDNEEKILLEKSDLVLATSSLLLKKVMNVTTKSLFLPNAGEYDHFHNPSSSDLLKDYKKPIIGYFGSIAEWFDSELIEYLVSKRPDLTFLFIGHTFGSDIRELQKLENVHFLGERPYSELPKYLYDFNVCLIPFKNTQLIHATHPVKIYEYLAAGKPVVTTNLDELKPIADLCYIAKDKEDFLEKLDIALKENDNEHVQKRIKFASKNTWQDRFEILYSKLEKIPSINLKHHN